MPVYSTFIVVLVLLLAGQTIYYFPQLSATVASHFDGAGQPNGLQSRGFFFGLTWGIVLVVLVAFLGIPRWMGRLNPRLFNIPNKEYWLVPTRFQQAMNILANEMGWYCVAVIAFIVYTIQLVLQANVDRAPLDSGLVITGLAAFLSFTIIWTIRLYRKLAIPKS